jgi:hypothetical protein
VAQRYSLGSSLKLVRMLCSACISAQREQESQRGLGTLVLAHTVHVQAVATAAGARIVKRQAQIVSTEEPSKARRASATQNMSPVA